MNTQIKNALMSANGSYVARQGAKANLNKSGINPDIAKALSIAASITEPQHAAIEALEIQSQMVKGLTDATNTKKPMRTLQALLFTITGDGRYLKGSAKTFILEFCGLVIGHAKTREALAFSATGKGDEHTSDTIKIAKARQVLKAFGAIGVSTESTQNSVSFSAGGIAAVLGVATKDKRTSMPIVDLSNKVAQALDKALREMSDSKIALLVEQSSARDTK